MRLTQKIKSYYIRHDFYLWKEVNPIDNALSFTAPGDEVLMDIGVFIGENIEPSDEPGNERHRLLPGLALQFKSIDEVLILFQSVINDDLRETKMESGQYNWDFRYRCGFHAKCENTITVSTVLKSSDKQGFCVYNVVSVRLFDGIFYCWNHLK